MAGTISASLGVQQYDAMLISLRAVYRPQPVVEILLVAIPCFLHIGCAVTRFIHRRRAGQRAPTPLFMKTNRWSGYFLLLVIFGHVIATRVVFLLGPPAQGSADYSYLAYSLGNWSFFFIPYYLLLGSAGAIHLCTGAAIAIKVLAPNAVSSKLSKKAAVIVATIVTVSVLFGLNQIIRSAPEANHARFNEFYEIIQKYSSWMGPKQNPFQP